MGSHPHPEFNSLFHILGARASINQQMGLLEPGDITQMLPRFSFLFKYLPLLLTPQPGKSQTEMGRA